MLSKSVSCPSCEASLKLTGTPPAGKKIRCPKCQTPFLPDVEEEVEEVVEAMPDEEEDDRPVRKARPRLADDERPAPRKARRPADDDEDDEGDRPAPRKAKKKRPQPAGGSAALAIGLVVAGLLVIGGGVTAAVVFWPKGASPPPVANNTPKTSTPEPEPKAKEGEPAPKVAASGDSHAAGRKVYESLDCSRCHSVGGNSGGAGGKKGFGRIIDLSRTGADASKTVEWISEHIRNPKAHSPQSRMPSYNEGRISASDLRSLSEFLASLKG